MGETDFETIVLGRVVGGGDHNPCRGAEVVNGKVEKGCRDSAQVDHVAATVSKPLNERLLEGRSVGADIPAHSERGPLRERGGESPTNEVGNLRVQFFRDCATDVAIFKDAHGHFTSRIPRAMRSYMASRTAPSGV